MTTVLVLGGARSGKSAYAERLLQDRDRVTYVAPGPAPDPGDAEWTARIQAHRARRPARWNTVEGTQLYGDDPQRAGVDLPDQLTALGAGSAALVDCLGTWVTRLVDEGGLWDDRVRAEALLARRSEELIHALRSCTRQSVDVVLVTNETGLGVVPATSSGRLFRDLLGRLNTAVAGACDHAVLVVAGRVLDLTAAPAVNAAPTFGLSGPVSLPDSGIDIWADAGLSWAEDDDSAGDLAPPGAGARS